MLTKVGYFSPEAQKSLARYVESLKRRWEESEPVTVTTTSFKGLPPGLPEGEVREDPTGGRSLYSLPPWDETREWSVPLGVERVGLPPYFPEGIYLHGTDQKFDKFVVPHPDLGGSLFFSDTSRRTEGDQAISIASGPFGGYLVAVRLKPGKFFNPYDDPIADQIRETVISNEQAGLSVGDKRMPYEYAPDIIKTATPHGYNMFEFYESSVRDFSMAVTDADLIEIVKWYRYEPDGSFSEIGVDF